jgi:hypothetical protein
MPVGLQQCLQASPHVLCLQEPLHIVKDSVNSGLKAKLVDSAPIPMPAHE